jgi:hypothetical protein
MGEACLNEGSVGQIASPVSAKTAKRREICQIADCVSVGAGEGAGVVQRLDGSQLA